MSEKRQNPQTDQIKIEVQSENLDGPYVNNSGEENNQTKKKLQPRISEKLVGRNMTSRIQVTASFSSGSAKANLIKFLVMGENRKNNTDSV